MALSTIESATTPLASGTKIAIAKNSATSEVTQATILRNPTDDSLTPWAISTGGTHDPLPVGLVDKAGDQQDFTKPGGISVVPTVDTAAYTAGDNLDGTIITLAGAVATDAGSGWIAGLVIRDFAGQKSGFEFWFLNASITPPATNAAMSLSVADERKVTQIVSTAAQGTWYDTGSDAICIVDVGPPKLYLAASGTTLYCVVKVLGTPTYAASTDIEIDFLYMSN